MHKLKKTIYIGLGGTGVTALLKIKKCFIDSYGEVPPMIAFLAIDTDGAATSKSETGNRGQEITLDKNELLVCTVKGALAVYQTNPNTFSWVPDHNILPLRNIQGGGAGQVRSNGRFIAYYNNSNIQTNIQNLVNRVTQLLPPNSPFQVDLNTDGMEYPIAVNVFASVAGGTGSGMIIDMLTLVQRALDAQAQAFRLYPWIVLPEIFRAINSGPSMANVLYNAYGALRELDSLVHLEPNMPSVDFGYTQVNAAPFDYAFIINNTNQAGTTFSSLDDIMDVVAKCAFLPANQMGASLQSPFDNILNQIAAGTYNILNKKAWAASTGSAELVYDRQSVARAMANRVVSLLCSSMMQANQDGTADANAFVDSQNVLIRENQGRDDVIDYLLSPTPNYILNVDENTTESDIDCCVNDNCNNQKLFLELQGRLDSKLDNVCKQLDKTLSAIMTRPQGKIAQTLKFITSLKYIISLCQGEMTDEEESFREKNQLPPQWSYMLNEVPAKGFLNSVRGIRTNQDAVDAVENKVRIVITNKRQEIRRSWALKFYNSLLAYIDKRERELVGLSAHLETIERECIASVLQEQNNATATSNFQIFLHDKDVERVSGFNLDGSIKNDFLLFVAEQKFADVEAWIGLTKDRMRNLLWKFAEKTAPVQNVLNTDIDAVLKKMPAEEVKTKLNRLKNLASPLWTYNTQGYNNTRIQLDRLAIVGVGNRNTSILTQDPLYKGFFDTNSTQADFATTNQSDRICLLIVEDTLPIYAVNGFSAYKNDTDIKTKGNANIMSNYLDKKWQRRMESENFDVLPTVQASDTLQLWVYGFVFGYIHFDQTTGQYWIKSKQKGDAIKKWRYDLGAQRDVAYNTFCTMSLDREVKSELDKQSTLQGTDHMTKKIEAIKESGNYLEEYSQLSPNEYANLDNPKYKDIRDLITKEITEMS